MLTSICFFSWLFETGSLFEALTTWNLQCSLGYIDCYVDPRASASLVVGLKAYATTPHLHIYFKVLNISF